MTVAPSNTMLWLAVSLFVATYAAIISERVNRAIVALLGAGLMIVSGVLNQQAAIAGIDFNTLGLLAGMMIIVNVTKRSGLFQFVAVWAAKRVKAHPIGIMIMMSLVTAAFSALLDNVTTVLLMVPVILLITEELKLSPYPYLLAAILMSNIGGGSGVQRFSAQFGTDHLYYHTGHGAIDGLYLAQENGGST